MEVCMESFSAKIDANSKGANDDIQWIERWCACFEVSSFADFCDDFKCI